MFQFIIYTELFLPLTTTERSQPLCPTPPRLWAGGEIIDPSFIDARERRVRKSVCESIDITVLSASRNLAAKAKRAVAIAVACVCTCNILQARPRQRWWDSVLESMRIQTFAWKWIRSCYLSVVLVLVLLDSSRPPLPLPLDLDKPHFLSGPTTWSATKNDPKTTQIISGYGQPKEMTMARTAEIHRRCGVSENIKGNRNNSLNDGMLIVSSSELHHYPGYTEWIVFLFNCINLTSSRCWRSTT